MDRRRDSRMRGEALATAVVTTYGPKVAHLTTTEKLVIFLQIEGLSRPVSRILLYPAIHLRCRDAACCVSTPGSLWEPRLPARLPIRAPGQFGLLAPVVYLAGPSRDTAGGLLPHPFTHHLCRMGPPLSDHRLVYSLLHLTWRRACAAPPLGFLARAAFPGAKKRALASPDFALRTALRGRITATGRTVQRPTSVLYPGC